MKFVLLLNLCTVFTYGYPQFEGAAHDHFTFAPVDNSRMHNDYNYDKRNKQENAGSDVSDMIEVIDSDACTTDKIIIERLLANYKNFKTPSEIGVNVSIEVWVQEVNSINELTSDFELDLYITEIWYDAALNFEAMNPCKSNLSLTHEVFDSIWKSNVVFINSKQAHIHRSPFPNVFLMIYQNGKIWVNYRMKVTGPCVMRFEKFPMDSHKCSLTLLSFNYNKDQVYMTWVDSPDTPPISLLKEKIELPDFGLTNFSTSIKEVMYPAGQWNELTMEFQFDRRFEWYILQAYSPTVLIIFVSWIGFALGKGAIPARTMLQVNSLLALTFQLGNIMKNLPRCAYIKALDVWVMTCLAIVFLSLIELAIVGAMISNNDNYAAKRLKKMPTVHQNNAVYSPKICLHNVSQTSPHGILRYGTSVTSDPRLKGKLDNLHSRFTIPSPIDNNAALNPMERTMLLETHEFVERTSICNRIKMFFIDEESNFWNTDSVDTLSMLIFPTFFGLFNICYWTYYLS